MLLKLLTLCILWTCSIAFITNPQHQKLCYHDESRYANSKSEEEGDGLSAAVRRRNQCNIFIHRRNLLRYGTVLLPTVVEVASANADDQGSISPSGEIQCDNGRIASESQVPGAYQQICMGLQERSFELKSGDTITVRQGTNSGGESSVAGRTGVAVWNSSILLTRLIDEINQNSSIFKEKTVLELGCGVGLASICLAKFGTSSVIATDANVEVLGLAKQNFELNNISTVAKTAELHWGLLDASEFDNVADIVVGSDLTYNSGSWVNLAETIATVLKPNGFLLYLTLGHSGFLSSAELSGFVQVAQNQGLQVLDEEEIIGQKLNVLLQRVTTTDEKQVINANGGARAVLLGKKTGSKFR